MSPDSETIAPIWLKPLLERIDRLASLMEAGATRTPVAHEWISAAEMAQRLGVSKRSIQTWEQLGKIPKPARVGRLKKWNWAQVESYLSKRANLQSPR